MVFLGLENRSNKAVEVDYGFSVNDGNGKQVAYKRSDSPVNFAPVGTVDSGWGYNHFAKRSLLLNSLVNGTLVIEVRMKLANLTQDNEEDCCVNACAKRSLMYLFRADTCAIVRGVQH